MEATLVRKKVKKQRQRLQQTSDTSSASVDDNLNCSSTFVLKEAALLKDSPLVEVSENCSIIPPASEEHINNVHSETPYNDVDVNTDKVILPVSSIHLEQNKCDEVCDKLISCKNTSLSIAISATESISTPHANVLVNTLKTEVQKTPDNKYVSSSEKVLQHMYPDLKCIEQVQNIISSQTLVRTYAEKYHTKTVNAANKGFKDFMKVIADLDKHPFNELIHQYQTSKKSCYQLCSRLKYLKSDLKRKKDSLWKSVRKEISAKGKCEDGNTVRIVHSYIIKELDQDKFYDVIKILKEIEDSVPSAAFNLYSEELMKLRIEHYVHNLTEESKECFDSSLISMKQCISILFNCERQNFNDKSFIETCQAWLKLLGSDLLQNGKFSDNLFLINHILRCPNGIKNWASSFVQVRIDMCTSEGHENFDCPCLHYILVALYLVLNPVPHREIFLKNIEEIAFMDAGDATYTVLDSDNEEEEIFQMSKCWSDDDVLSLLNQIPLTGVYKNILLDDSADKHMIKMYSEDGILKLFAFSTVVVNILFEAFKTYSFKNYPKLHGFISSSVKHILQYVSVYWSIADNQNNSFKSKIQAVYEKLFFHIAFRIYSLERFGIWNVLSSLPYKFLSKKMLWNILWICYSPGKSEEEIYSEKDVERKIKDECVQDMFPKHLTDCYSLNLYHLLHTFEALALSSNSEEDFLKFIVLQIYKITFVETSLRKILQNEGKVVLSSVIFAHPNLISVLIKEIDKSDEDTVNLTINLFKELNFMNWLPEEDDISILTVWLLSNPLTGAKNHLARLTIKRLNWGFTEDSLFLPYHMHQKIGLLVVDAYMKYDACSSEWMVSRGVKQILQFATIGSHQREDQGFVHWAWNIMFSLKLHPLDKKRPPWISIYDGSIEKCYKPDVCSDISFDPLLSALESDHPAACYLMLVMTEVGLSVDDLKSTGLKCLLNLIQNQQYMAAIKSLYYILPFFVKNSELLLEQSGFIKAVSNLIAADMTIMSNITGEPVIGAVLSKTANMIKYQIYQALDHTVECAAPLIKLWIKILLQILYYEKNTSKKDYSKQVYFLLDVIAKISFAYPYTRDYMLDILSTFSHTLFVPKFNPQASFLRRIFSSSPSVFSTLNRMTIPEYPWLAWFILSTELKQEDVQELWSKVQDEMMKDDILPDIALKKVTDLMKIDRLPMEFLPNYRWALQIINTPVSHPVYPLFWQQFFIYYFQRLKLPDSQGFISIGKKFFRSGQQLSLFEKMKAHLIEAEKYFVKCIKNTGAEDYSTINDTGTEKVQPNSHFHLNLLKLFRAFSLWMSNDSLHNSELCFSALEPKYCLFHLELILSGNQNTWFDLVLLANLKDDFEYEKSFWSINSTPGCMNSVSYDQSKNGKDELLHESIFRHLEKYETIEIPRNVAVIPSVFEVNEKVLSSWDILEQIIEKNQHIIFKRAECFTEQLKALKQLNFNFINWIPQKYIISDTEVTQNKTCHKVYNCSGAARFILKVQKVSKNERICERIHNNRADYLILQEQLSKFPVNDLCIATLQIENFIKTLASKMKSAKNEDATHLKKMGVTFFYHQVSSINKFISSVAEYSQYSPSRQFFSSVIESLGREFVEGDDSQLLDLAKSILNNPESGLLALPLFNPVKSSITNFLSLYETLSLSVGKCSASTLLALFSKINFSEWLKENTPSYHYRREIFKHTCNALQLCGYIPLDELLPVFEVLRNHFRIMLLYMFPELFPEAVYFLLNGLENKVCVDMYYETFHCFGCPLFNENTPVEDIANALKKFAENQVLPADQQIFISIAQLNLKQIKNTCYLFSYQFAKKMSCSDLYKNNGAYIKPLGIFIALVSHSLVELQLQDTAVKEQELCVSDLWETFHSPFCSWLHPAASDSGLTFPWSDSEIHLAHFMLQIFVTCTEYFHERLSSSYKGEENVLSYFWNYYVEVYVLPNHRHYMVSVNHCEFLHLPWHKFLPSARDVEGMCKVLQSNLPESKEFLSKISLKISWPKVINDISHTKSPAYVGKILATLGRLVIISQYDATEVDSNLCPSIFKELKDLPWHLISLEDTEELLNLFYSKFDQQLIFDCVQEISDIPAFQFLKWACCMVPSPNDVEYSNCKRVLYLQKFKSTLNAYLLNKNTCISNKIVDKFKKILPALLDEIENICRGINAAEQITFVMPLVKEVITFLNILNSNELEALVIKSVVSWIYKNEQSPLILSCLKVSSSYLNSVIPMVPFIESCIRSRFSNDIHDAQEASTTWALISSCFCVTSKFSKDFVIKCIDDNAFLSLYCYILHKQPHAVSKEQKKELLQLILKWIRDSKLSSQSEAKFLLLWDKILDLSIALASLGDFQVVQQELVSFCWKLDTLAEDKSNSGFLATFGLGQTSSLSVNFRFLCRVMAAYILCQIPDNFHIRIEPMDSGHISLSNSESIKLSKSSHEPSPSKQALTAVDSLKMLQQKRSYAALQSHIDYAVKFILDPNYTLSESRKVLKYFAVLLFPEESYLFTLDSGCIK